jgi:hypothetical protein
MGKQRGFPFIFSDMLAPLSRPTDMLKANGRVYILEFNRQNHVSKPWSGTGRLLELTWD